MPESPERRRQVLLIRGRINARWGCLRSEPLLEQQVMRLARALRVRCSETEQAQLLAGFIPEWMEEEIVADGFLVGRPAGRPPAAPPAAAHAAAPGEGLGGERAPTKWKQRGELGAALASEDAPAAPDAPEAPLAVAEPAGPPERVLSEARLRSRALDLYIAASKARLRRKAAEGMRNRGRAAITKRARHLGVIEFRSLSTHEIEKLKDKLLQRGAGRTRNLDGKFGVKLAAISDDTNLLELVPAAPQPPPLAAPRRGRRELARFGAAMLAVLAENGPGDRAARGHAGSCATGSRSPSTST